MKVKAYDTYYPENTANTTVRITVRRNQNAPQFSQSAYETEINEFHPFGLTVFTVSAGDADRVRHNSKHFSYSMNAGYFEKKLLKQLSFHVK